MKGDRALPAARHYDGVGIDRPTGRPRNSREKQGGCGGMIAPTDDAAVRKARRRLTAWEEYLQVSSAQGRK
jgi:hypothetical protein